MDFYKKRIVVLYGPTGVGKSDIAERIASILPAVIVNLDMGQCYTPLSIGTAKPDWQRSPIPHYLFDILDTPENFSAYAYKNALEKVLESVWQQGKIPILVGGSGFYLKSLFFPPSGQEVVGEGNPAEHEEKENLWEIINSIDPERAALIHPHDTYRLQRAYALWKKTGRKPSHLKPSYSSLAPSLIVCLTRDRQELYQRIDSRVLEMFKQGWVAEVERLAGSAWEDFLREKKLIGYDDIIRYLHKEGDFEGLISTIQQKTRNYAKRQLTFWRMFERQLSLADTQAHHTALQVDLTLYHVDLYISQLSDMIIKHYGEK